MRRAREWRTRIVQRLLHNADELALDAVAEPAAARQPRTRSARSVVRPTRPAMRVSAVSQLFTLTDVRPKRPNRATRLDQMRARQIDRRIEAPV